MVEQHRMRWPIIGISIAATAALVVGGWQAGRSTGAFETQQLTSQVSALEQDLASARLISDRPHNGVTGSGSDSGVAQIGKLQSEVQRAQAEANQFRSQLQSELANRTVGKELLAALFSPGVKVRELKALEKNSAAAAYLVVVPASRLIFIGSNLPKPGPERQFQIWIEPKEGQGMVSAGLVTPGDGGQAYLEVDDPTLAITSGSISVTDEPLGGSVSASGSKLLAAEPDQRSRSSN